MNDNKLSTDRVLAATKHLQFVDRNGWSFVQRISSTGVVCIVAVTRDDQWILVEQQRPPVGRTVIELPAGLAGDIADQSDESLEDAARRELLEETGYQAERMEQLLTVASCPGVTDETVTFFAAHDLAKVGAGGGDDSEDIQIHLIPRSDIDRWLADRSRSGSWVDARVYTGIYLLSASQART